MPATRSPLGLFLMIAALLIVVGVGAGVGYEQVERAADRGRFPQIGRSVDIGGRALNLDCLGAEGPVVIFAAGSSWPFYGPREMWARGLPRPGYSWVAIQREVATFARACWYDRAGTGWSDPGPYPRDSAATARDLHALLAAARIPPPYVLVAEASAALDAQVYTGFYPADVSGLVLVDPAPAGLYERAFRSARQIPEFVRHTQSMSAEVWAGIGLWRLAAIGIPPAPRPPQFTSRDWDTIQQLQKAPNAGAALIQQMVSRQQDPEEARAAGGLGDRPLVVLTPRGSAVAALQGELASLSTRGKQVVVETSEVPLPYHAPESVIGAIREMAVPARRHR